MTHPARFSTEIIDVVADILRARWPDWLGRPVIFDPFAGTGERLHDMCQATGPDAGWSYSGTEIEADMIEAPAIIHGSATDPDNYPPVTHFDEVAVGGWVVFTSPVYPNGMADNFKPRDASKRHTYRAHKIELTGDLDAELDELNMGRYGYRGTKRPEAGGTSARRRRYWEIASKSVANWRTADLVILNVSDFKHSNGEIEPVVADWERLLEEYGWTQRTVHPVGTRRQGNGANRDERVAHEVVIVAERGA